MHGRISKSVQYIYFVRFSLALWLFPLIFAFLDSGALPISTTTLSRGIFVPEYLSGYLCVSFFIIATGCVALITARTVVINGCQRFPPKCPDCVEEALANPALDGGSECREQNENLNAAPRWLKGFLANDAGHHETRAIVVALIPAVATFVYLTICGSFESVPIGHILGGLLCGTIMAVAFWYVVNALYYFAYEPTVGGNGKVVLGKNAARTILLPRSWFFLRLPGADLKAGRQTLEDIETSLRDGKTAKLLTRALDEVREKFELQGYVYADGRLYEAQLFSAIAAGGFIALFWILYPLTAPRPNNLTVIAIIVLLALLWRLVAVIASGKMLLKADAEPSDESNKDLKTIMEKEHRRETRGLALWKLALAGCALFFGFSILYLWLFSDPERFPTMASVLLLAIVLAWVSTALAFWLDRHRVPVLTFIVLVGLGPRVFHAYDLGGAEEHYASTVKHDHVARLQTPAEILDAHLKQLNEAKDHRPLIIVTATGGGLHASAWTAQVMRQIELHLSTAQSPVSGHILLASTVSGGSVGLSYYLSAIKENPLQPDLNRMVVGAQCSSLEAVGWGLVYFDMPRAVIPALPYLFWRSGGDGDLDGTPLLKDRTWALRKAFERNAANAYCRNSARTAYPEDLEKDIVSGEIEQTTWYERLFPTARSSTTRLTVGALPAGSTFPAFTMNTTTVEAGDRFLLGNYRLPQYQVGPIEGQPAESFVDVFYNRTDQPDLPLASAAQMSATFPYVSSAVRIPTKYDWYSEHFVDGGYYDDDGTSSALEFLRYALDSPVGSDSGDEKDDLDAKADISQKGPIDVLLIEIRNSSDVDAPGTRTTPVVLNAGKPKAGKPWNHAGLLQQLGFPLAGFWNAGHGSVTGRDRNGLDLLIGSHICNLRLHQIIFDDQPPTDNHWYIHSAQDPLSWSLTPKERAEVARSSDPGPDGKGWLNYCYQQAAAWFNDFGGLYDPHKLQPTRCSAKPTK